MADFTSDYFFVWTRKEHQCDVCGEMVPKKSIALYYSGYYDNSWYRGYRCFACAQFVHYSLAMHHTDSEDLESFLEDIDIRKDSNWLSFGNMSIEEGLTHESTAVRFWTQQAMAKIPCRSNT